MKKHLKLKLLTVFLSLSLFLTTAFGLFSFSAFGAGENNNGLRFIQVEGGNGFSIALTYDGQLYGWGSNANGVLGVSDIALNSDVPRKIPVTLAADEKITKIAVSSSNCAAVTDKGFIYTWGSAKINNLLLQRDVQTYKNWQPAKISKANQESIFSNLYGVEPNKIIDIVAGENHFVIKLGTNDSNGIFAWGSNDFFQVSKMITVGNEFTNGGNDKITQILPKTTNTELNQIFAGGNSTAYYDSANLKMAGKNFALVNNMTVNSLADNSYAFPSTMGVATPITTDGANYNYKLPIKFGATDSKIENAVTNGNGNNNIIGMTQTPDTIQKYLKGIPNYKIHNSKDNAKEIATVTYKQMTLGSTYGYAIGGSGSATADGYYAWGLNTDGQAGNAMGTDFLAPTYVASLGGDISQIVTSKIPSLTSDKYNGLDIGSLSGSTLTPSLSLLDSGKKYISAYLTTSNKVFAWGYANSAKVTPANITDKFPGVTTNNPIVGLSTGYDGVMYAITKYGKIYEYKINDTKATLFDSFKNESGGEITNWDVNSANNIIFSESNPIPESGKIDRTHADTVSATVMLDSWVNSPSVTINNSTTYKKLVPDATNFIGDSYRFLVPDNLGASNIFKPTGTTSVYTDGSVTPIIPPSGGGTTFTPSIKFVRDNITINSPVISDNANNTISQYIDYYFVGTNAADLGIQIIPKKSTRGKPIKMSFDIARIDNANNAFPLNGSVIEKERQSIIEIKTVSIEFNIDNTNFETKYTKYDDSSTEEVKVSNIPVLDANNPTYKNFSIAAMDVSSGFDAISKFLNTGNASTTLADIKDSALVKDAGFPALSKQSSYYGAAVSKFSTDEYQYFTSDRDGHIVKITKVTLSSNLTTSKITTSIRDIELKVDVTSSGVSNNNVLENFDNTYGFTHMSLSDGVGDEAGKKFLNLKYQVVTLTAVSSTNSVSYNNNDIKDMNTGSDYYNIFATMLEQKNTAKYNENDFQIGSTAKDTVSTPIHIQSSLTLDKGIIEGGAIINGDNQSVEIIKKDIDVGVDSPNLTVNVSSLFKDTSNIYFSHMTNNGDSTRYDDYTAFIATFDEDIIDVSLTATTLKVTPKVEGSFGFSIVLRRFQSQSQSIVFDGSEILTINYTFTTRYSDNPNNNSSFSSKINQGYSEEVKQLTQKTVQEYFNGVDNGSKIKILQVASSDTRVLKTSFEGSNISFIPISSGKVTFSIIAMQFEKKLTIYIDIKVVGLTTLSSPVKLFDIGRVYLADLKTSIGVSNNYTLFKDLEVDRTVDGVDPGYYFLSNTSEGVWQAVDKPSYISSVNVFVDNGYIDIELGAFNSTDAVTNLKIVVKFINNSVNSDKFEAAVNIQVGRKYLTNVDNSSLTILYDTDVKIPPKPDGSKPEPFTGNNYLDIPAKYLASFLTPGSIDLTTTKIILVTTESTESYKYFNFDYSAKSSLRILPRYSSEDAQRIDVVLSDDKSSYVVSFFLKVSGITTTLSKELYNTIFLSTLIGVFILLFIIFVIRLAIYWKQKAQQKRIIKKNQLLIKMRDKMHNKTEAVSKEKLVRTKLKMEDPKYAKMFTEMRKTKEAETGITLENSFVAHKAENKVAANEKIEKKKKGGKKSIEELKAELDAKKAAFAQMQMANQVSDSPVFESPDGYSGELSREDVENQIKAKLASDEANLMFDIETVSHDQNDDTNK